MSELLSKISDALMSREAFLSFIGAFAGAFLAFIFFVIGEFWILSKKKRNKTISSLDELKEYIVLQKYPLEINKKNAKELINVKKSITIYINRFHLFEIENQIYLKLGEYKVAGSILKFIIGLKFLNESTTTLNSIIQSFSDFSRMAMLEKRESDFKETMDSNTKDLKEKVRSFLTSLESVNAKIMPIVEEINFTLWYERSYFWQKIYFRFRQKLSLNYRHKMIKKINNKKRKNREFYE